MSGPAYFDVISGRNRRYSAALARLLLRGISVPYAVMTDLRNLAYDRGWAPEQGVPAPVISIGNITTGGSGKTPVVAWLTNQLSAEGFHPAIVSRGYRSLDGQENDEKRLLDALCPGVPHVQNRRRVIAARLALAKQRADVLVLDDGFQHRRLHRDVDVVLIDALNPWGYDALLPRGLLRERLTHLRRADVILITRSELAGERQVAAICRRIARATPAPIVRTSFQPLGLVNSTGATAPLELLANRKPLGFCGIGNPEGFRKTLAAAGSELPPERCVTFPDHHHYPGTSVRRILQRAKKQAADLLVTTRKDLVKLPYDDLGTLPLWALEIGLTFLDDPAPLWGLIKTVLPGIRPAASVSGH